MGRAVVSASEHEGLEIFRVAPLPLEHFLKYKVETFSQFQEIIFTHRTKTRRDENVLLHLIVIVLFRSEQKPEEKL